MRECGARKKLVVKKYYFINYLMFACLETWQGDIYAATVDTM